MKNIAVLSVLAVMLVTTPAMAQDAARMDAAKRYAQVVSAEQMVNDMLDQFASNPQVGLSAEDIETIRRSIKVNELNAIMVDAMVKNFTADEMNAMSDFYGSATGKSIMKKMPAYMNDVMPAIQKSVMDAVMAEVQKKSGAQ